MSQFTRKTGILLVLAVLIIAPTGNGADQPARIVLDFAADIDTCDCSEHLSIEQWPQQFNVLDVVRTVNVAFRSATEIQDPDCPVTRTDLNCDGHTDVLDVVAIASVSFRGYDPAVVFCDPCGGVIDSL